mmetsp:Transcript_388/g.345  ORF Transcript_388/g.345 Transcript_388/m.345 type:complete len:83 (+) Transcript_388:439-687(+)
MTAASPSFPPLPSLYLVVFHNLVKIAVRQLVVLNLSGDVVLDGLVRSVAIAMVASLATGGLPHTLVIHFGVVELELSIQVLI